MKLRCDVAIMGAGPAGLALASECAMLGINVVCVAPQVRRPWVPNYGLWGRQESLISTDAVARRYDSPRVHLHDDAGIIMPDTYLRLSRSRLQRSMFDRSDRAGVGFLDATVIDVEHGRSSTRLATSDGGGLEATLAVDATGFDTKMIRRAGSSINARQTAFGIVAKVESHPYAPGEMSLMDFRFEPEGDAAAAPSFLYALPLDDRHIFVEETALVQAPAMPLEVLEARLQARLASMDIRVLEVVEEERCSIAMDLALPDRAQRLLAFGAAASMVHPATGYQLASALERAPEVARAILRGLELSEPAGAARTVWESIWPDDRVRLWSLYRFGMAALASFDLARTRLFFESFFALRSEDASRYLDATVSPTELGAIMARLFWGAPFETQWRLIRHGMGSGRRDLWRAATLGGLA